MDDADRIPFGIEGAQPDQRFARGARYRDKIRCPVLHGLVDGALEPGATCGIWRGRVMNQEHALCDAELLRRAERGKRSQAPG